MPFGSLSSDEIATVGQLDLMTGIHCATLLSRESVT